MSISRESLPWMVVPKEHDGLTQLATNPHHK